MSAQTLAPCTANSNPPPLAAQFPVTRALCALSGGFVAPALQIRCVKGDLFSCPATDALAHCISEDCRMGAGIAVLFKKKFGGVQELLDQSEWRLKELLVPSREGAGAAGGYGVWLF